jgi:hypothetical protein
MESISFSGNGLFTFFKRFFLIFGDLFKKLGSRGSF